MTAFTANTDARVSEIAATNTTVYVGGVFVRVNNVRPSFPGCRQRAPPALSTPAS